MENLKDLDPEVARKLVAFIDAARDLVGDPACLEAFQLLGVASAQLKEVLGALGISLTRTTGSGGKINKERNFDPCHNCRTKNVRCKIVSDQNSHRLCEVCKNMRLVTCDSAGSLAGPQQEQANSPDVIEADDPVSGLPVIPTPYGAFGSYAFAGATQDVGFEEFPIGLQVFAPMSDGYPGVGGGGDCMASPSTSPFTPTPYNQVPNAYQALKAETPGTNNQGSALYPSAHYATGFRDTSLGDDADILNAVAEPARHHERGLSADFDLYTFLQGRSQ